MMNERLTALPWEKLVAVFEREGFRRMREHGDHIVMVKAGIARPLVIPRYRAVPVLLFGIIYEQQKFLESSSLCN